MCSKAMYITNYMYRVSVIAYGLPETEHRAISTTRMPCVTRKREEKGKKFTQGRIPQKIRHEIELWKRGQFTENPSINSILQRQEKGR